jgi:hypothetical protein
MDVLLPCPICFKGYKNKVSLRMHLRYHNEDAQIVCDFVNPQTNQMCGRKFINATLLKVVF